MALKGLMRLLPVLVVGAWSMVLLSGCAGNDSGTDSDAEGAPGFLGRGHPYPNGDEWPRVGGVPLTGPFDMLSLDRAFVTSTDGTELHVWIVRPDLPDGAKAPVVLWASPYWGTTQESGGDPALWDNSWEGEAVPVNVLVENGYAVAIMNLRGSGLSGGCFTMFGSEDWDDTAVVVDWLGSQEWSNGRVGMMGLSYHGTTPWQAAVRNPEHLKTIVTAGMVSNLYTFFHTDQGAAQAAGPSFGSIIFGAVATAPPNEPADRLAGGWAPRIPERACPETAAVLTELYKSAYTDLRSEEFWEERRIVRDFADITASVLLTHGLRDLTGHAVQEDAVWGTLAPSTPKRMISGQWGHMFPNFSDSWTETRQDWDGVHLQWFDFWLKGIGEAPPGEGRVEFQDDALAWYNSTSWPPAEATQETLHLCPGTLAVDPCDGAVGSFLSAPAAGSASDYLCDGMNPAVSTQRTGLVFLSEPLAEDVVLAGNPFGLIELESNEPGGLVSLYAYEVDGQGGCGEGFRRMAFGGADLRHHDGNYVGRGFPIQTPTSIRFDMTNLAERVAASNRIAVVAHYADPTQFEAVPFSPMITFHGGSHLVWPVLEGTLGGSGPPAGEYPPRPFIPNPETIP